jgi:hypothetical protein
MNESILRDFFLSSTTAAELSADLEGSLVQSSRDVIRHPIVDMDEEFEVRPEHLLLLCDAVLAGQIEPWKLQAVGFCLVASDQFYWDGDSPEGDRVGEVAFDWSVPEINYSLTHDTVAKFRHLLATGEKTFTPDDFARP